MSRQSDRQIDHNEHRAVITEAMNEAYQAIEEAKTLINQHDGSAVDSPLDSASLLRAVKDIEWRLDRVESAITLMHANVIELSGIVQDLRQKRDDTLQLVRAVMGRLMQ